MVNRQGTVSLGHQGLQAGSPLAGLPVTIRLDGQLAHLVLADGTLWRTVAFALSPDKRARLHGAHSAGPAPPHLQARCGCSAWSPAAAASKSSVNACRSASRTPA